MDRVARVYALICPETKVPRYVGKTSQRLLDRLNSHIQSSKRVVDGPKAKWISALLASGKRPEIHLLAEVSIEAGAEAEREWLEKLAGHDLLNVAPAGSGNPFGSTFQWTPEIDAKLGVLSDSDIAAELGCDRKTVTYRRNCLGISAGGSRANSKAPPPMGGWNKITIPDAVIERLGTVPDKALAREIGADKSVIASARKARGIPSFAAQTGNDGRIRKGEPHRRWS